MCVTTNNRTVGHRVGVHAKVLLMGLCIAVFSGPVQCQGKTAGAIVAVDVAPAAHEVTIRSDRPMTAPKGVVLHRPNRLAMDFDSSRIGPVPGKIKVEKAACTGDQAWMHRCQSQGGHRFWRKPGAATHDNSPGQAGYCQVREGGA